MFRSVNAFRKTKKKGRQRGPASGIAYVAPLLTDAPLLLPSPPRYTPSTPECVAPQYELERPHL
jgi:hypothetical protein